MLFQHSFALIPLLAAYLADAHLPSLHHRTLDLLKDPVCVSIENAISSASSVYYPGQLEYQKDISHWASSSTQLSKCTVEPGTPDDVSIILGILASTETPFAVKGGGHATNPGSSSTSGVLIAMYRFSEINYKPESQTVTIGAGLVWDDVYAALAPHNVNVIGGRVSGVGVAGFTLGGGYSWKTNQYGLTIDTVVAYELVKPTGAITTVTSTSDPDLFFALKGGMNNFGIVTRFTLKTFPQTQVWGGVITYTADNIPAVSAATAEFSDKVTDPKASIITTYNFLLGQPGITLLIFYDAPTPPPGIFDSFLAIPSFTKDCKTRDFLSLVKSSPSNATAGLRGIFNTVPLTGFSPKLLAAIVNETEFWGNKLSPATGAFISYDVEPFLPTILTHGASASAYPPSRTPGFLPFNIYYAWALEPFDSEFHDAARESAAHITNLAIAEGQPINGAGLYPNYAIFDTPLTSIYGGNLDRLRSIKAAVDPSNIMGQAGGFKI
ncbi:FAD-binding domain-containing protein [Infundibulicybe gibba]|nr:FAD-binding domain-containing protein [Infundibulicybe gibba]